MCKFLKKAKRQTPDVKKFLKTSKKKGALMPMTRKQRGLAEEDRPI